MTIETWSAGLNGAGVYDTGTGFGGSVNYDAKPQGEGWSITGYRTVDTPIHPKYGSSQKRQVPIYSRTKPGEKPADAPKPAAAAGPEPTLNTKRIEAAKAAAEPYRSSISSPSLAAASSATSGGGPAGQGFDPYRSASQFGVNANSTFSKLIKGSDSDAKLQTTEMGEALSYYLQRFKGAVPKLTGWRDYYDPIKSDILKA